MTDDTTDADDEPTEEEIKTDLMDAIPDADAVACVALKVEDDGINVTSGRALADEAELTRDEQFSLMMAMDEELGQQMFNAGGPMAGGPQMMALSKEDLDEMGVEDELIQAIEEMVEAQDGDSTPGGMFQ